MVLSSSSAAGLSVTGRRCVSFQSSIVAETGKYTGGHALQAGTSLFFTALPKAQWVLHKNLSEMCREKY